MEDPKKQIMRKAIDKSSPATLYVVRHGHTSRNGNVDSAERVRGWDDIPLNDQGKKEAEDLAKRLKQVPIKAIWSSDLSRAVFTAEAIAKGHNLKVVKMKSLRPWNLGDWQGKPVKEVLKDMKYHQRHPEMVVPGGESWQTFLDRYLGALKQAQKEAEKKGTCVIVGHYRSLVTAHAWVSNGEKGDSLDQALLDEPSVDTGDMYVMTEKGGKWSGKIVHV